MRKSEKKALEAFDARVSQLAEAYGIQPPSFVASQIMDLAVDLSDETFANTFALVTTVVGEVEKLWNAHGKKPNILVDAKLKNAVESFSTKSPEFAVMMIAMLKHREITPKALEKIASADLIQLIQETALI